MAGFPARRLTTATMRAYAVEQTSDGQVLFPYHDKVGKFVALKIRGADKTFKVEGEWKGATLFGQDKFPKGGKVVTLTEGEFDALAVFQMTGVPSVSIRTGAQGPVKT